MAVIHKSKHDPRRRLRAATLLMILCLPLALLTAVLGVLFYIECFDRLKSLAHAWQGSFSHWAIAPGETAAFTEAWHRTLWSVLRAVLRAVGWVIYGGTLALPGLTGLGVTALLLRIFLPCCRRFRELRARVRGMKTAVRLLGPMPGNAHLFVHKRFVFEGEESQADLILVGTGGVLLIEVRNLSGLIEGSVTDPSLKRRLPNGDVQKIRNPARQAAAHVTRLSGYLNSRGLNVWVTPCVLFISPGASAYVTAPEELIADGRRSRISSCVVTDAVSFWDQLGRSFAMGCQLGQPLVEQLAEEIRRAPEGKRR
ncbi:MAG: NERD domain-containing protein [Clostridia bacterium]|nr:NERD domain-containing protein [Clostridia bacterium]